MKVSLRIARMEFSALFFSPIAWLLLVVFGVQSSMVFNRTLEYSIVNQNHGLEGFNKLTEIVFVNLGSVFPAVTGSLLLYVPLLTMGLISRELYSGSIKLLLSSPVRLWEVVAGKYLAMMAYFLLFMAILAALAIAAGLYIENLDYPLVFSGVLGVYLLVCAYAAIGLYMSCLTSHQVVAAISTLAVLFVLDFIGSVGQRIPVVGELAYWMSISGRVDYFRNGLITTRDVFYFLLISALFLGLTHLKLSAGRKMEAGSIKLGKYLAFIFVVFTLGYLTAQPRLVASWDMTREKKQTLSPASAVIVDQIEGPLTITAYANLLDPWVGAFLPAGQRALTRRLFDRYQRAYPDLSVDYKFYYGPSANQWIYRRYPDKSDEELARQFAYQWRLDFDSIMPPQDVDRIANFAAEEYQNIHIVEWNGKSATMRSYDDISHFPSETEISAALGRLTTGAQTIAYVSGHGERSPVRRGDGDHQHIMTDIRFRPALISQGFDIVDTSLDAAISDEIDILVLADPTAPLSEREFDQLRAYVASGRNLLIVGEPDRDGTLTPVLSMLGVEMGINPISEPKQDYPDEVIFADLADRARQESFEIPEIAAHQPVLLNQASPLQLANSGEFDGIPLLTTASEQTVGVLLSRRIASKEQRIVIVGDADFMSNAELARQEPPTNNHDFIADIFEWLSEGRYPVDTSRPPFIDRRITIDLDDLDIVKLVCYGVIPGVLVVLGGGLLYSRRRQ